jgi:hypothetical protein
MPPRIFCEKIVRAAASGVPCRDLADEQRNVDRSRAGRHAGRIMAEVAAIRRYPSLMRLEPRGNIAKIRCVIIGTQPT